MRLITAWFARALRRCTSRIGMQFLLTFQEVMSISKTRNQLTGNRIQKKRDGKVGAPSPCHPFRSATNRQSLFMPPRPFLMPSSAHRAQGIVKNLNPFSTKKLGAMSGGMKYMPGTTP